ncbi:MAG: protein-L-isoaspartate O-methyltransferase [Planctomycetota bacterium]|nr:protein-L-isoaspartate O-methyltransferase [Planctomycetota bacterium]
MWEDAPGDQARRAAMLREQLGECRDPRVRAVMASVPRHWFVSAEQRETAYGDGARAIGCGQTISQPRVVAYMLTQLAPQPGERVLDFGAGSGYVSVLLAHLVGPGGWVRALERQGGLVAAAEAVVAHCSSAPETAPIELVWADGVELGSEQYDCIHVACAAPEVPQVLIDALAPGGRMVVPVGVEQQQLRCYRRDRSGQIRIQHLWPVSFVPLLPGTD